MNILKKIYEFLKKIPQWIYFVVLIGIAALYYVLQKETTPVNKEDIIKDLINDEVIKNKKEYEAEAEDSSKRKELETTYEVKHEELTKEEERLDTEIAAGPVAIAKEWNNYLKNKK